MLSSVCFFLTVVPQLFFVLSINVSVKRCGGAYGARITRSNHIGAACALAAYVTKRYTEFLV